MNSRQMPDSRWNCVPVESWMFYLSSLDSSINNVSWFPWLHQWHLVVIVVIPGDGTTAQIFPKLYFSSHCLNLLDLQHLQILSKSQSANDYGHYLNLYTHRFWLLLWKVFIYFSFSHFSFSFTLDDFTWQLLESPFFITFN